MRAPLASLTLALSLTSLACGGGSSNPGAGASSQGGQQQGGQGGLGGQGGQGASSQGGQGGDGASAGSGGSGGSGGQEACLGSGLLADLGVDHVMVGVSTFDAATAAAPFDLRYRYLSGGLADGAGPCASCATGCTSDGQSCDNANGCGWWGCWQYDQDPPGAYVRDFVLETVAAGRIPMISYYEVLHASGVAEGQDEVAAMTDAVLLGRLFADFRFLLEQIGDAPAIVHHEPDFWGYAQQTGLAPGDLPAAVPTANPTDCADHDATIAGLGACLVTMTRKYAPNAKIGLHGSPWATNYDVVQNTDPAFDVAGHAAELGAFLLACAPDADLVIVDGSDRDAGWDESNGDDTWWDETNQTLPNFHQAFAWSKALSESMGKGHLWWQLPVGNSTLPNQPNQWKDNRVEYFFAHWDEVAAAHGVGAAFGAGEGQQTTPETDGGLLVSSVTAYAASGGEPLCQ